GWDLHPRARWERGDDWAIADVIWGTERGSDLLEQPAFQLGNELALVIAEPGASGTVGIWDIHRTSRIGFVPEPHAPEVKARLTRRLPMRCVCTWQWRDAVGAPRSIRCLYATTAPELVPPEERLAY